MGTNLERDGGAPWLEPFASVFLRTRILGYATIAALLLCGLLCVLLYSLGTAAAAHVYEVHPDGRTLYIGEREANLAPRKAEVVFQTKEFVLNFYGFNSSTVKFDLATAVSMAGGALSHKLREEIAENNIVDAIQTRGIRTEVEFTNVEVVDFNRRQAVSRVSGAINEYPLTQYEGSPTAKRPFALRLVWAVVPRNPTTRLAGLELVRLLQDTSNTRNKVSDQPGNQKETP